MRYHGLKMAEINKIIKEYWINTYKGSGKMLCFNIYWNQYPARYFPLVLLHCQFDNTDITLWKRW